MSELLARWHKVTRRKQWLIAIGVVVLFFTGIGALSGGGNDTSAATADTTTEAKAAAEPTTQETTVTASTPKDRVRKAIGSEVDASGYAGTLQIQDVAFEGREAQVTVTTPGGGFQGASCDDLNDGAKAVWAKVYNDAGWNGGALVVFKGGLVSTVTGEDLPDVNTGIFTIHADQAARISWANDDSLYNIDWSYYRDFCHPALKQ